MGIVLWVHGGGWYSRETTDVSFLESLGLTVVHARFRLSGEAHWPAQLDDLRAEADAARVPGVPFVVAGHSSGGHLALQLGLRTDRVDAVLAFSAPVDPLAPDWPRARVDGNPWHRLLGHPPADGDAATRDCSVGTHPGNGVPVLLAHGTDDEVVPPTQSLGLAAELIAAGHPARVLLADGGHGDFDLGRPDLSEFVRRFVEREVGRF